MPTVFEFEAIGTSWQINIEDALSENDKALSLQKIKNRIGEFDLAYSRFRPDSLVTKMSEQAGEFTLPPDADKMLTLYKKMYDVTGGLVTPLIGQVLSDAGYDASYSLEEKPLTKPLGWEEVLNWVNPKLILSSPSLLDFGAGGKGYLVDIVSEILEEAGVKNYCVDAGGDMRQRNAKNEVLKVGLENPTDVTEVVGIAEVMNKSICGSAGNRRKWGKFHHIINPETLSSPTELLAVWCIASETILADLLTTALFFVSPQKLQDHFEFEYLILRADFSVEKSDGFKAELFV